VVSLASSPISTLTTAAIDVSGPALDRDELQQRLGPAEWLGIQPTLLIGAIGMLGASVWVVASPMRALRLPPEPLQESRPTPVEAS
jgi:hypothetical protein